MTFANALRSILRQDPDIIMIGEIRDGETASIAVQASITGHLVLSTIHTNNAVTTLSRLSDMGVERYLVADSVVEMCIRDSYITMGMCYASDPYTKEGDVTIHRLCLQSKDEMTMFFTPGVRHLDAFREKAEKEGVNLPISISIGVDPAIEIASCFEPPTTPLGFNELSIAGAIRKKPVELVKCRSVDEYAIARACLLYTSRCV